MFSWKSESAVFLVFFASLSVAPLSRLYFQMITGRDKTSTARDKIGTARDKKGTARDKTVTARYKTGTDRDKTGTGA